MVLEMMMESVFAVVDIFFVSKLGADAVATVGITESLLLLIYAIAFGLSAATTALVSRRIGEKKSHLASIEAYQAVITGLMISVTIAFPGFLFAKNLLAVMGSSPAIIEQFSTYTSIMLGSNAIIMMLFINNAIFRGAGNPAIAMKVLWLGNIINLVLDPILIFGWGPIPAMGIAGAAIATTIGRGIAVIYQLSILFSQGSRIQFKQVPIKPDWLKIKHLLSISLGGIAQSIIGTSSWLFMMRLVTRFGSEVIAGYTISIRIIIFAILPSWGLSNAAATLTGQNLGAGKPERAEKAIRSIAAINAVFLGIISLALIAWPHYFIGLFTNNFEVIAAGSASLRIIAYGFAFYGVGMVLVQSFNGAGDTRTPTIINLVAFWMTEIPLAYLLSIQFKMQANGIYYGILFAESCLPIFAYYLFKQGKWKTYKI